MTRAVFHARFAVFRARYLTTSFGPLRFVLTVLYRPDFLKHIGADVEVTISPEELEGLDEVGGKGWGQPSNWHINVRCALIMFFDTPVYEYVSHGVLHDFR